MAKLLVSDALWEVIAPRLPPELPEPKGGRPRIADRAALTGLVFVLKTGLPWQYLPQELGCGSRVTCWRCWREWPPAGVWHRLHQVRLDPLWRSRPARRVARQPGGFAPPGKQGGGADQAVGPNPTERGTAGSQRHLVVDRQGIPRAVWLTAANVHDAVVFEDRIEAVAPLKRPRGRPRQRPDTWPADQGDASPRGRASLRRRGRVCRIARRGIASSEQLGRSRWAVEPTFAGMNRFRRFDDPL